jgi:hypothetical protein
MLIVEPAVWWASGPTNANAFPPPLKEGATDVGHRLATLRVACSNVRRDVPAPGALIAALLRDQGPDVVPRPGASIVIVYDAVTFVSSVYGMLVTAKTLLDVLAPLVTRAIAPGEVLRGFNKGTFDNEPKVPGGALLNWLRLHSGSGTPESRSAAKLFQIFKRDGARWINQAVKWRDAVVHSGRLISFIPMQATVVRSVKTVREDEVVGPLMPDRTPVVAYANGLLQSAAALVDEAVRCLPGVDESLLSSTDTPVKT